MARISGVDQIAGALNNFLFDTEKAIDEAVHATAQSIRKVAIKSIQTASQGNTVFRYREGGGKYQHVAGKEGEAPNTDTGRLAGSIAVEHEKGSGVAFVGTTVEYGAHLEFGFEDVNKKKHGPWPWLEPAAEDHEEMYQKALQNAIEKQIEQADVK